MKRRAQTATEYLIILAVVIVIALILIGVMSNIPAIGGSSSGGASSSYWKTSPIGVQSYAFAQVGADSIVIRNNFPGSIVVTDVRLSTEVASVGTVSSSTLFLNAANASLSNQTLKSGETYKYENASTPTTYVSNAWTQLNCNAGESYSYYIEVDYRDVATGATFTFDGDDTTIDGTCAN